MLLELLDLISNCKYIFVYSLYFIFSERESFLRDYEKNDRLSRAYHAYDAVHRCVHEPFSLSQPDALLNASRYVLSLIDGEPPMGISMLYPLQNYKEN